MRSFARTAFIGSLLVLPLGGCESLDYSAFDPTEWFSGDIFSTKKPLQGRRKPVFPEGVPGVERGVPPELVRGNQPPPGNDTALSLRPNPGSREAAAQAEEPKPKPKPKARPKPKPAQEPATATNQSTPTPVTVRRSDFPDPPPPGQQPTQPPPRQPPPPVFGGPSAATPGGVQWPDPPPPTSYPR